MKNRNVPLTKSFRDVMVELNRTGENWDLRIVEDPVRTRRKVEAKAMPEEIGWWWEQFGIWGNQWNSGLVGETQNPTKTSYQLNVIEGWNQHKLEWSDIFRIPPDPYFKRVVYLFVTRSYFPGMQSLDNISFIASVPIWTLLHLNQISKVIFNDLFEFTTYLIIY